MDVYVFFFFFKIINHQWVKLYPQWPIWTNTFINMVMVVNWQNSELWLNNNFEYLGLETRVLKNYQHTINYVLIIMHMHNIMYAFQYALCYVILKFKRLPKNDHSLSVKKKKPAKNWNRTGRQHVFFPPCYTGVYMKWIWIYGMLSHGLTKVNIFKQMSIHTLVTFL